MSIVFVMSLCSVASFLVGMFGTMAIIGSFMTDKKVEAGTLILSASLFALGWAGVITCGWWWVNG